MLAAASLHTAYTTACNLTETMELLEDGRTLAYCQYGANRTDSAGIKTVIHNHGSGGSRLEWPGDEDMLNRHSISFVSVDRPGHGIMVCQTIRKIVRCLDGPRTFAN